VASLSGLVVVLRQWESWLTATWDLLLPKGSLDGQRPHPV